MRSDVWQYVLKRCEKIWHNYILKFKNTFLDGKKVHKKSLFWASLVNLTMFFHSVRISSVTIRNKNLPFCNKIV